MAEADERSIPAGSVTAGHQVQLGDGRRGRVLDSRVEYDDFGTPALVVADLEDGGQLRIAFGSTVTVSGGADIPALIPADEATPEGVVAAVAVVYPDEPVLQRCAERLSRGLNFKSGSSLQDVRDLAHILFLDVGDEKRALQVADLITDQPFDGNFGRWTWIEQCLALAAQITRSFGDDARAARYATALRSADDAETDPLKAKVSAELRQRRLNEPNLYDREIARAAANVDQKAERDWRLLRLGVLMYLRAHGGSETLSDAELGRRINNELVAVRLR